MFDKLKIGTQLTIKPEPENPYDANAIALYFEDFKIGYIPRNSNAEMARLCQAGYSDIFEVGINRVSPENSPEDQVGIVVFVKNK